MGTLFFAERLKFLTFGFLRNKIATYILGCIAIAWVGWVMYNLGEPDFGQYKTILLLLFCGAGVLAFHFLPDFLSVRALVVILILAMRQFVDSAFMQEPQSRLVMVAIAYVFVVLSVYFGCLPYRLRDAFEWLYANGLRHKIFACTMWGLGLALSVSMFFY